jgi:hypothetical protein
MIKSCRIEIQEIFKSSGQVHLQALPHAKALNVALQLKGAIASVEMMI